MRPKTTPFDPAGCLSSEDDILDYLKIWMEDGSPREIARAIGDVARSKGMSDTALSENGNPTLETLLGVLGALGLELTVRKRAA